ncbi:MAG: transposase [Candidatus Gracilibacteria bacterium]|nr:transposase [Candidatus Gracilibacteria bacterium]MDQ7023593.1 transposase [Candidatus Gracilibacteria bacterium]
MKKTYHITWTTFNSRVSERMKLYRVKTNKKGIFLDEQQEYEITVILEKIILELELTVLAYNICNDHIHIILVLEEQELSKTIGILKGKSTKLYKDLHKIEDKINLWGQKFDYVFIENIIQLLNTINYVKNNRKKHGLNINKKLEKINFCKKVIT